MSAPQAALSLLARQLHCGPSVFTFAGTKDKRAVTEQVSRGALSRRSLRTRIPIPADGPSEAERGCVLTGLGKGCKTE